MTVLGRAAWGGNPSHLRSKQVLACFFFPSRYLFSDMYIHIQDSHSPSPSLPSPPPSSLLPITHPISQGRCANSRSLFLESHTGGKAQADELPHLSCESSQYPGWKAARSAWGRARRPGGLVRAGPAAGWPLGPCPAVGLPAEGNVLSTRVPAGWAFSPGGGCKHRLPGTLFSSACWLPEERDITTRHRD